MKTMTVKRDEAAEQEWRKWRQSDDCSHLTPNSEAMNLWAHRAYVTGFASGATSVKAELSKARSEVEVFQRWVKEVRRSYGAGIPLELWQRLYDAIFASETAERERAQIASVLDQAEQRAEVAESAYSELAAQCRTIIENEISFYESPDEMGPLYRYWEDGQIGNWDDGEWDWERTLNACRNDVDCPTVEYLATGEVNVWPAIQRYRRMRAALAEIGPPDAKP